MFTEMKMSAHFVSDLLINERRQKIITLATAFIACKTMKEKKTYLKASQPGLYVGFLKSTKQTLEIESLFDGTVTAYNMSWYIEIELLPLLRKMRKEGKLTQVQN